MKISELTNPELDYWVATATHAGDPTLSTDPEGEGLACMILLGGTLRKKFAPSSDWAIGGPLIEGAKITVAWNADHWIAGIAEYVDRNDGRMSKGPDALTAAMRAYLASRLEQLPDGTDIQNG